ncbi:MAG: hypothetical protein ALECFALPRED_003923 [Alectoria fallacina]|uniref:Uncharacterized protein n=1 Tax=Alectoria fallacina TaxID=1903189 RepID=A0A8H3FNQ8_9LECA|nr:MAG: hypothetical protein ALECFALPRED_003923 [Alectoria fallacina]
MSSCEPICVEDFDDFDDHEGEVPETRKEKEGDTIYIKSTRGVDPRLYKIFKILGKGHYELCLESKIVERAHDPIRPPRGRPRRKLEPRPDRDATEKAGAVVGPSAESIKVETPINVEMDEFKTSISYGKTDVDDSKLRLGETSAKDGAPEQPENIAIAIDCQ